MMMYLTSADIAFVQNSYLALWLCEICRCLNGLIYVTTSVFFCLVLVKPCPSFRPTKACFRKKRGCLSFVAHELFKALTLLTLRAFQNLSMHIEMLY